MANSVTPSITTQVPLVRMFEAYEEATQDARKLCERDRDYRDIKQWTSAEEQALKKRKQPVVTFDRIGRKVDYLLGLEKQMRKDPRAFPRTPGDEGSAEAATDSVRYVCDDSNWDMRRSEAFEDIVTPGTGAIFVGAKQTKNGVDPSIVHIPWDRLWWDEHSSAIDFSDAGHMGLVTWMDVDDAKRLYPGKEDIIESTMASFSHTETYDDKPKWSIWSDPKRKRVRIIEGYYLVGGVWHMCIATKAGELVETQPSPYLDEDGKPECPIKAVSYYIDRDNNRYGGVRRMIGPQDEINKRRSKGLHFITMRQSRISRSAGVDAATVRTELAKPDGSITADKDDFEILPTNDMAAANLQMLQEAKAEIDLLGPNAALAGKNEQDQSGRAILAQQQGGMVEVALLFDRLRVLSLAVYRSVWARIRQYWTEERWIRVTDDERNLKFVGLNRPVSMFDVAQEKLAPMLQDPQTRPQAELQLAMLARDPMGQQPVKIENAVAELDVDIVIDEGMDTPTVQAEQFDTLLKTLPALGPVAQTPAALSMIVEASSLRNKDKLLALLEEPQQPQIPPELMQQMEAMQQALAELQATVQQQEQALADKQGDLAIKAAGVEIQRDAEQTDRFRAVSERIQAMTPEPQSRPQ